ncbi:MAG: DUF1501 domain-containing protein [Acetobacteraceae bacterium]|nr:DUF1501 domain-containing protein [Acetobacteraceae bacterium]
MLTRRTTLLGLSAAALLGRTTLALAQAPTAQRFVVVLLRGALDGMAAVVPYGDPNLRALRGDFAPADPGRDGGVLDLGGFYGLHPSLPGLHGLYGAGELLPVHAVAGPYRTRSHFEGQDYLESGAGHALSSGWLNRAALALGGDGGEAAAALAFGYDLPLLLRGPARTGNWAPPSFGQPEPDLYSRIAELHAADPITGPAIAEGLRERGLAAETQGGPAPSLDAGDGFRVLAAAAGRFLRAPDGPRIAALEIGGWDTHVDQRRRLGVALGRLDDGLLALKDALGDVWGRTAVLVLTEFGRTARPNGTAGTDHGTGTVAFVLGGAVAGGKVAGTWPGLGSGQLLESRDLQPTTDLRSIAKGLLRDHMGLNAAALDRAFPASRDAEPFARLLRA